MTEDLKGKSVVVVMPCYNDWESVKHLVPEIDKALAPLNVSVKVVIVDDASFEECDSDIFNDNVFSAVTNVIRVSLARNLGSQRSIAIGVAYATEHETADYLIVADSDHQDKAEDMPRLLQACADEKDKKVIFAQRANRSEGPIFRMYYSIYQLFFRLLTNTRISMGSFSASPWKIAKRLSHLGELWNHFPGAIIRSRIPYDKIPCDRGQRQYGESKMNVVPLLTHAFSGFALFSDTVAARLLIFGFYSTCLLAALAAGLVGLKLFTDLPLVGWTSTLLGIMGILFLQIITASGLMLILVSSLRMQPPIIPNQEYKKYLLDVAELFPARQ